MKPLVRADRLSVTLGLGLAVFLAAWAASAEDALVHNADLRDGTDAPAGWTLSGGKGRWVDREILEVTGTGKDSGFWRSADIYFAPAALYHFQMRARRIDSAGLCISGPAFANRDYDALSSDWQWYGHVFRTPDNPQERFLRVGQWEAKGTLQFDAVKLTPTIPVYRAIGNLLLGEGESIRDGRYVFSGTFGHEGSNFHRTLASATAGFNSDRWCLYGAGQVTYRFHVPGHPFLSAGTSFNVNYHARGDCVAEASRDGREWRPLATQKGLGTGKASLPADLFPAETIFLRLRPAAADGNFQVNRIEFQAALSGKPPEGTGGTLFADVPSLDFQKGIEEIALEEDPQSGTAVLRVTGKNPLANPLKVTLAVSVGPPGTKKTALKPQEAEIPAGGTGTLRVPIPANRPGAQEIELDVGVPGFFALRSTMATSVPEYYRSDYGERIAGVSDGAAVWWCDATWKIPRRRPLPGTSGPAARLSAAKNDREAVQIVVRPGEPLQGLTAAAGPLIGPGGATIPAEKIKILRVYYHFVHSPTDATGVRDWWPDALPPLTKPIDVAGGENQPLWVLVHVPEDAKAGDYTGSVALKADGWSATVPLRLHVWDFALPKQNHLVTAFGFSAGTVFRYHQIKTEADKRKVLDLYFQSFAEHRISPYDPTPLDPIRVNFVHNADPPRTEVDFAAFDEAFARALQKYRFTNFSLPVDGMGGGTFHARVEPKIGPFGESTPQYQAMFAGQVKQLEEHLRKKGWLEMAYTYWFDEPEPKDYAFVRSGMERIKRYAPGIQRMLTEEPQDELGGAVDIWCPVSFNYNHEAAEKRRARGERVWWYVCCGPKAPFCTLFIDHPATELRVWLWQTWQRKIVGTLVWSTNWWTSGTAFPDKPQNPYEDPMGYVDGYGVPRGTKQFWGNGDGRFIYPPEAAAVPGHSGPDSVIAPPVSSIRWEMLREGVEDYEYLYLLRELIGKKRSALPPDRLREYEALLDVPESITKDMTTFTKDPAPTYARRAAVAEAIERLTK